MLKIIVCNKPPRNKTDCSAEIISDNNLGGNLVQNVAQTDRSKLGEERGICYHWNKNKYRFIDGLGPTILRTSLVIYFPHTSQWR